MRINTALSVRLWHLLVCCAAISFFSQSVSANDSLTLNGVAKHPDNYYIASLYLPSLETHQDAAVYTPGNKRMLMRISTEKWRERSFYKNWNQAIIINNSEEDQQKQAKNIQAFGKMLKGPLFFGDQLEISVSPGKGTRVKINGTTILTAKDDAFFAVLLRAWIGNRPFSTGFKQALLNQGNAQQETLLAEWDQTLPADQKKRYNETKAWGKKKRSKKKVSKAQPKPKPKPKPQTAKTQTAKKSIVAPAAASTAIVAGSAAAANSTSAAAQSTQAAASTAANTTATASSTAATPSATAASQPTTEAAASTAPQAQAPAASSEKAVQPEAETEAKNYQKYSIITQVAPQYPQQALDEKIEGYCIMQFTISVEGKVLNPNVLDCQPRGIFEQASTDALSQFLYSPSTVDGKAIETKDVKKKISYRLEAQQQASAEGNEEERKHFKYKTLFEDDPKAAAEPVAEVAEESVEEQRKHFRYKSLFK